MYKGFRFQIRCRVNTRKWAHVTNEWHREIQPKANIILMRKDRLEVL